jgi:hypothetical protein
MHMGQCDLNYTKNVRKKADKRALSMLRMDNWTVLRYTPEHNLSTYIFQDDFSVYLETVLKGKDVLSQIILKEAMGFDGRIGNIFIYREANGKGSIQTELYTQHKVITFLSSFFVASQRVALGTHKKTGKYNLIIEKSVRIVEMKYGGREQVPFKGKQVTAEVILLTNPNNNHAEVCRMNIFKDPDGYFFPVSIRFLANPNNSFELKAERIIKKP